MNCCILIYFAIKWVLAHVEIIWFYVYIYYLFSENELRFFEASCGIMIKYTYFNFNNMLSLYIYQYVLFLWFACVLNIDIQHVMCPRSDVTYTS